jgi:hypothetical protein
MIINTPTLIVCMYLIDLSLLAKQISIFFAWRSTYCDSYNLRSGCFPNSKPFFFSLVSILVRCKAKVMIQGVDVGFFHFNTKTQHVQNEKNYTKRDRLERF